MSATSLKSPPTCRRCGNPLYTGGARGLCLPCLSATTIARFSASEGDTAGDDLRLEEGLTVGPQNRFLLHDKLGAGGMGEVWLATDQELSREDEPHWVALKFLSASIRGNKNAIAAVRTEVIRSQELSHPNIVRVFDLHTTRKGMPFIKMEYVKGNSLSYWLQDCPNGVMRWKDVVDIALQLCGALQYAHETAGVIHRDIKPGNILLRTDRIVKLTDFGIAEALYNSRATTLKKSGLGTLWYASPQQISGQRPMPADDMHAVGATLYELLAGSPPFIGDTQEPGEDPTDALINQVRYDPPEPIGQRQARRQIHNDVPSRLADLIYWCLEKEPQKRPLAREVIAQLHSIKSLPTAAQTPAPLPQSAPPPAPPAPAAEEQLPEISEEAWEATPILEPQVSAFRRGLQVVGPILILLLLFAAAVIAFLKIPDTRQIFQKMAQAKTRTPTTQQAPVSNTDSREQPQDNTTQPAEQTSEPAANPSRPEEPTSVGQLDLRFPKLANHANVAHRIVSIVRSDNRSEIFNKTIEPDLRRYITPDLPTGSYNVTILEKPSEWRTSVPALVSSSSTTPILITSDRIVFSMKVQPPDATLVFPPGVGEITNHVGEYLGTFWSGTFPVYAFASGYGQEPSPELVTVASTRREQTIVLQKMRFPVPARQGWPNSLHMDFRYFDTLGLYVSVAETRVSDFREFCKLEKYNATDGMYSVTRDGIKQVGRSWSDPGPAFEQQENFPVIGVSWNDGMEFCKWLTRKERDEGVIRTNQFYRLPKLKEWYVLAGDNLYPWGSEASGIENAPYQGNYSGVEMREDKDWPSSWLTLAYNDRARRTAPAGSPFRADRNGLYHVGGNAAEWTLDQFVCGGSWADGESEHDGLECLKTHHAVQVSPTRRDDRYGFRVVIETQK